MIGKTTSDRWIIRGLRYMNKNLWKEWGPRFKTAGLMAAWWIALPLAMVLLVLLYPLGIIVEAAERDADGEAK